MLRDTPATNFRADIKTMGIKNKNKELGSYQTKDFAKQYKKQIWKSIYTDQKKKSVNHIYYNGSMSKTQ